MEEVKLWRNLWSLSVEFIQFYLADEQDLEPEKSILEEIFHRTFIYGEDHLREEINETKITTKLNLGVIFRKTSVDYHYSSLVEIFSEIFSKRSSPQKSQLGQEFTPIPIIEEIVAKCMELSNDNLDKRWLDAGCGAGFFIGRVLINEFKNIHLKFTTITNVEEQQAEVINLFKDLRSRLGALDIDPLSIFATSIFLNILSLLFLRSLKIPLTKKIGSLLPPVDIKWQNFLGLTTDTYDFNPDIILGNPPYIFYRDISKSALQELRSHGFKATKGQFDLSDVFIEQSLKILPQGGVIGVIIPEILLVLDSRDTIRKEIITHSEFVKILPVSDAFHHVSVENILLFARKNQNHTNTTIQIEFQNEIMFSGNKSQIGTALFSMLAPQKNQPNSVATIISWINDQFLSINEWNVIHSDDSENQIHVFRGVELSKRGEIMQCPSCKVWMPFSTKLAQCKSCNIKFHQNPPPHIIIHPMETQEKMIKNDQNQGLFMQNFTHSETNLTPDAIIQLNHPGINYKSLNLYELPRIGIRQLLHHHKICAAYLPSKVLTSQSVYNIRLPSLLQPHIHQLIEVLRSETSAYYLFVHFSHGKKLFQRILLNKLKQIPFIPKLLTETPDIDTSDVKFIRNFPKLLDLPKKYKKIILSQLNQ